MTTNGSMPNGVSPNNMDSVEIRLHISDRELCDELARYAEGQERHDFAVSAMKIGAIALRQAQSRIDAEQVRLEGDRFIENLGNSLAEYQRGVTEQISNCLKDYFDPDSGRFNERVKRLIGEDGELERLIRGQVEGDSSRLAQTLTAYVGKDSPMMQTLNPESPGGLISQFTKSTEDTLTSQRERILSEFSLDNGDGALSRLVTELKNNHGEVGKTLENRIEAMTSEFSLDREDSALSRLMDRVETAQRQISSEFSLDAEGSALARMRKELLQVIENQRKTNEQFQNDVIEKLAGMTARRQESERSTRHGVDFEDAVFSFINELSQKAGDIADHTGNKAGLIRNNKKGDIVVKLGPDHVAAGAQIVVEAKQDVSYNLDKALSELEEGRKNRGADIGLFVFSARTAPDRLEMFGRYGNDIVVVWDSENSASDVFFDASLSVAKALCVRAKAHRDEAGADFEAIEKAILEIQKQANSLEEITKSADSISSSTKKILERARIIREALDKQMEVLNGKIGDLREVVVGVD